MSLRRDASGKGTLAGVSAHPCTVSSNSPPRAASLNPGTACAAILVALTLAGCGFSGALYLPEEPPPVPAEEAPPQENALPGSP